MMPRKVTFEYCQNLKSNFKKFSNSNLNIENKTFVDSKYLMTPKTNAVKFYGQMSKYRLTQIYIFFKFDLLKPLFKIKIAFIK